VFRVEDSRELGRGALTNNEETAVAAWHLQREELYRVVYRCDDDILVGGDGGNEYFRECVDGQWTGQIPLCGKSCVYILISWA